MMLTTNLSIFNGTSDVQTSPELRRMDMLNRARREETEAMIFSIDPRQGVSRTVASEKTQPSALISTLNSVRNGIGHLLISAGSRIQSAA